MIIANTSAGLFSFSLFVIKTVHRDALELPT